MTIHNDAEFEAAVAALTEKVRREIELVDAQITKSRAARGYVPTEGTPSKHTSVTTPSRTPTASSKGMQSTTTSSSTPLQQSIAEVPLAAGSSDASSAPSSSPLPQQKGGPLLNFGRPRMLQSFKPCYFVVDAAKGFQWWENSDAFRRNPAAPTDSIPFFEVTTNSRASRFKKAVTCWPLILPEDCAKATDRTVFYFALEYLNPKAKDNGGKTELLVLGAASEAERREWVVYITHFVKLFLPNRAESEAYLDFPVGSKAPVHLSIVLDGEAPR